MSTREFDYVVVRGTGHPRFDGKWYDLEVIREQSKHLGPLPDSFSGSVALAPGGGAAGR